MIVSKKIILNVISIIVLVFAGYYFHIATILGYGLETIPGDLGDSRLVNYILEHCYLFFSGQDESFWSAGFFYPFKNSIAISVNMLGTAPIYSIFRALSYDRETAYQLWIIALMFLNFFSATYVFYKVTGELSIAAIGGFIFAFNISMFGQYNHLQMLPRFPIPIAIYFAIEFIKTKNIKYYSIFIFATVYQFYCGIYLGFFLLLFLLFVFLVSLLKEYKSYLSLLKSYKNLIKIGLVSLLAIVFMVILLQPYYEWSKQLGSRQFFEVKDSIPTIYSYLFSIKGTFLWGWLENTYMTSPIWWDHFLFPGGFSILLLMVSLFFFRKIYIKPYNYFLMGFVLFFVFTLTIGNFTLYKLIFNLPGFNSIRALGRVINLEVFLLAFVVVITLHYFFNRFKYNYLFVSLALITTLLDQAIIAKPSPTFDKKDAQNRISELLKKTESITNQKCFAYCPSIKTDPFFVYHIDAMLLSQTINVPTVNGYSATCPGLICNFIVNLDTTSLYEWTNSENMNKDDIYILDNIP